MLVCKSNFYLERFRIITIIHFHPAILRKGEYNHLSTSSIGLVASFFAEQRLLLKINRIPDGLFLVFVFIGGYIKKLDYGQIFNKDLNLMCVV